MKVYCVFYTDYESNDLLHIFLSEDKAQQKVDELNNLDKSSLNCRFYSYIEFPIEDFEEFESKANNEGFKRGVLHMVHSQLKLLEE